MSEHDAAACEKQVRKAAADLLQAIERAGKAGLQVSWPSRWQDLGAIAISETGKVKRPATAAAEPAAATAAKTAAVPGDVKSSI